MRACVTALLCCALIHVGGTARAQEPIRIGLWNMNNLHSVLNEPLRDRAPARGTADYATMRKYARRLNADIVALQEVNGPLAARLVFPEAQYETFFEGRYDEDLATGQPTDRIYTGFAVRRGVFDAVTKRDVRELGIAHTDGRTVRWGTEIMVQRGDKRLRLLSIHLKSGCADGALEPPTGLDPDCITLSRQRVPLEAWIDAAAAARVPFAVLGDFNRRIGRFGQNDHLWGEINDGDPAGLELRRLPFDKESDCWRGTSRHFPEPIDFLVFDGRAWADVDEASFTELNYDAADRNVGDGTPSDHCPKAVDLRF